MNILMIGSYKPQIGGPSIVIQELVRHFKDENKIFVINMEEIGYPKGLGHWKDGEVDIYQERLYFNNRYTKFQKLFQTTKRALLIRKKVDLYHTHGITYSGIGFIDKKKPLVLTIHGYPTLESVVSGRVKPNSLQFKYLHQMGKKTVERADAVIAVGRKIKEWIIKELGADSGKLFYIPNGINIQIFKRINISKAEMAKKIGIENNKRIIVYAKDITEINGIRTLIKSMPNVIKTHPDAILLVLGAGPLKKEMIQLAEKLKIDKKIIFFGVVHNKEIPKFLNVAEIYCAPFSPINKQTIFGIGDTIGLAHLESMACGVPTISTKRTVKIGEFDKELNDSIIVVRPDDPHGLSKAINYLMENPKISNEIGKNGRNIVINNYTWKINAKKVLEVYDYAKENHKKRF